MVEKFTVTCTLKYTFCKYAAPCSDKISAKWTDIRMIPYDL